MIGDESGFFKLDVANLNFCLGYEESRPIRIANDISGGGMEAGETAIRGDRS